MNRTPEFESYYDYKSDNYGTHSLVFTDTQGNRFYYSYKTLVAFYSTRLGRLVCKVNLWKTTTGKHLNAIEPDKNKRVDEFNFDALYTLAFAEDSRITVKQGE